MTDKYNAVVVVLEENIRSDDAKDLLNAIRMIKGVTSVEPNIVDINSHIAYSQACTHYKSRLWDALKETK